MANMKFPRVTTSFRKQAWLRLSIALTVMLAGIAGEKPLLVHAVSQQDPIDQHNCRQALALERAPQTPPRLMSGIGSSSFRITTRSAMAQRYFTQGINLLHSFWDLEAYRSFREAARQDPSCAMAYWGIFTALAQNQREAADERTGALKKAVELGRQVTDREQRYIKASSLLVEPGKGKAAYISEMEALIDRYPKDVEAKLFLANTLSTPVSSYAPDGRPREGKLYGQAILRNLLITNPNHAAVHHYWIHAVENGPRPQDALESARKLPLLAPRSGHLLHMPGHIYYRLGMYGEARRAFLTSMRQDQAYMKEQKINPIDNWNYVHNLDYLVGTCAEDGRYEEGVRWARELQSIPVDESRMMASGAGYILYGGHTALARLQMRYGLWAAAAESLSVVLNSSHNSETLSKEYLQGVLDFVKGMDALERNSLVDASAQLGSLNALIQQQSAQKAQAGADWYWGYAVKILLVHALDLQGSILSHQGSNEEAIRLLADAVEKEKNLGYWEPPHYTTPVLEHLAKAYLRAGKYDQARDCYQAVLKLRPRSGHALFGLAQTYALSGQRREALARYQALLADSWLRADENLPQVQQARSYLRGQRNSHRRSETVTVGLGP